MPAENFLDITAPKQPEGEPLTPNDPAAQTQPPSPFSPEGTNQPTPPAEPGPETLPASSPSEPPQPPQSVENPYSHLGFGKKIASNNMPVLVGNEDPSKTNRGKIIFYTLIIFVVIFLIIAGAFGAEQYEKYAKDVPLDQILPGNSALVARFPINPEAAQFKLLDDNLKKFPGYETLNRASEGKSISQLAQEKLKEYDLDLDADIKPLLEENAYLIIPDIKPLSDQFRDGLVRKVEQAGSQLSKLQLSPSEKGLSLQLKPQADQEIKVMGESQTQTKPLDFIIGSEIKDLSKAKEVLAKLKRGNKYEITDLTYNGYPYYKFHLKDKTAGDGSEFVNYTDTYHVMLGKNWIVTSQEQILRETVDRRKSRHWLGFLTNYGKEGSPSLSDDNLYQSALKTMSGDGATSAHPQDALLSIFYQFNYNDLLKGDCSSPAGCSELSEYIKYPDEIASAIIITFTPDGMLTKSISNQALPSDQDVAISDGLAKKVPQRVNGKWIDLFTEYNNLKEIYHQFKENNLTDKGKVELRKAFSDLQQATQIDFERDFIDQFSGRTALTMFTKEGQAPEGALIAEIEDPDRILSTMKKLIDTINMYLAAQSNFSTMSTSQFQPGSTQPINPKELEAQLSTMLPKLTETVTPNGKIYSYKIPDGSFSFDFSLENRTLILATNYATVESLLKEFQTNAEKKLADNDFFIKAHSQTDKNAYSNLFLNTQGLWNAITYTVEYFEQQQHESIAAYPCPPGSQDCLTPVSDIQPEKVTQSDEFFAIGAILRTIHLVGMSGSVENEYAKSSIFINIQELPAQEKNRAEQIIDDFLP